MILCCFGVVFCLFFFFLCFCFFKQKTAYEILVRSRGLGDVYKRQHDDCSDDDDQDNRNELFVDLRVTSAGAGLVLVHRHCFLA